MADEERLLKVQRVYKVKQRVRSATGKVYEYRAWWGYYCEDARQKRVYLGRELPERFNHMISERRFSRSRGQYYWPKSYHRSDQGGQGVNYFVCN